MHAAFSVQRMIMLGLVVALCACGGTARAQLPPIDPIPVAWLPDLVAKMALAGEPRIVRPRGGAPYVQVPVRVGVTNQGLGAAGTFKVGVEYRMSAGGPWYTVAFSVPGQRDRWYPWTSRSLGAGTTVHFEGVLTFHSSIHDRWVDLRVTADSCSGDEFMPASCRVRESNEKNNTFVFGGVYLP
jgi:hypothetical protein